MNELKIQTVTGLIRKSPSQFKSHNYKVKSKVAGSGTRSLGLYAEKMWNGQIQISFNLINYDNSAMARAEAELAAFAEFAKAEGYKVVPVSRFSYAIEVNA